jgi:hypothetical protein
MDFSVIDAISDRADLAFGKAAVLESDLELHFPRERAQAAFQGGRGLPGSAQPDFEKRAVVARLRGPGCAGPLTHLQELVS